MVAVLAVKLFYKAIPDEMYVLSSQDISYDFGVPVTVVLKDDDMETFSMENVSTEKLSVSYDVTCLLLGLIPVKDIAVNVVSEEYVYASGEPVGIYAKSDGILVVAAGKDTAAEHLIKSGDYIVSLNGESVYEKEELSAKIDEYGADREIVGLMRNGEYIEVSVQPDMSDEGTYILGVWVRDDLAGVGTLTYYTEDGSFGALGHAISDGDTGSLFELSAGSLYTTNIIGIQRGEKGSPGELSGVIDYAEEHYLGEITDNTARGIHGTLSGAAAESFSDDIYKIAYKQDIETGSATIISSVSGEQKSYDICIDSVDYNSREENKGILFSVTDPELLELTGGIVQGMSGSPIIQNGCIIGAVTHVLVQDAAKGYGIFIEKMME
jgi:stage IV sporulation protein B